MREGGDHTEGGRSQYLLRIHLHMTGELDAAREELAEARMAMKRKGPRGVDHVEVIATLVQDAEVP